ncbi:unnamed protein product, partial [marine sediment metagenome]
PLQISTNNNTGNQNSSFETMIFFTTFYSVKGRVSKSKLVELVDNIREYTFSLKSAFTSNFHHFKISQLSDKELVEAFRSSVLKQKAEIGDDYNE